MRIIFDSEEEKDLFIKGMDSDGGPCPYRAGMIPVCPDSGCSHCWEKALEGKWEVRDGQAKSE